MTINKTPEIPSEWVAESNSSFLLLWISALLQHSMLAQFVQEIFLSCKIQEHAYL